LYFFRKPKDFVRCTKPAAAPYLIDSEELAKGRTLQNAAFFPAEKDVPLWPCCYVVYCGIIPIMKKKPKRINTGITLEPDVVAYLEELGLREDRDRSWLINAIVREHAERSSQTTAGKQSKRARKP
jgi:hypothetical protein